jgi:hypothetical protein
MPSFKVQQIVQIRPDQLPYMLPSMARQLDRRKGEVIDTFVPLGKRGQIVKVRWIARRATERDVIMEHPEEDLQLT